MLAACSGGDPEAVEIDDGGDATAPTDPATDTDPDAEPGEEVPTLRSFAQGSSPATEEAWRQLTALWEQELGLTVEVQFTDWTQWIERVQGAHDFGEFTITTMTVGGNRLDPDLNLREIFHSAEAEPGRRNLARLRNDELDRLIEAQQRELDEDRRLELIHKIQESFVEELPFLPLFYINEAQVYNADRFDGFDVMPGAGISRPHNFFSWINITPLTDQTLFRAESQHDGNSQNPFVASGGIFNTETMRWVYDTLARVNHDLELEPWAAESWDWVDDRTLDVHLRSDMVFHDGVPVTADDLTFTMNYAMEHEFPTWLSTLSVVESVETVDEYTTRFTLVEPLASFEGQALPFVFVAPEHLWTDVADPHEYQNPEPIGSGPWTFGHWRPNESWAFERNPDHWHPPGVDVLIPVIPEAETALAQLELGELDGMVTNLRGDEMISRFDGLDHLPVHTSPSLGVFTMYFNMDAMPGTDPSFRRALNHAIPRATLVEVIGGAAGGDVGRWTFLHPDDPFHNPEFGDEPVFDIELARQILAEAGYSWDDSGRLRYPAGVTHGQ